jgi:hypothetical protein
MESTDDRSYADKMDAQEERHEALCRRCGICCGATGEDPCESLVRSSDGRYTCAVYTDRLGPRTTRRGAIFACVTIRDVHKHGVYYPDCAYNPSQGGIA